MIAIGLLVAAVMGFVASGIFYATVPTETSVSASSPSRTTRTLVPVELLRNLTVAGLVAGLLASADWSGVATGALLGLSLWALPLVLLAGSVFHEGVPMRRAAIHAGDWLIKLVVIAAIVGLTIE